MDKYSKEIVESLKVFYLLEKTIKDALSLLLHDDYRVREMASRILNIDICSFVDEMDIFFTQLRKEKGNYLCKNKFLLLTFRPRKLLHKNDAGVTHFRNTLFAHNYRNNKKGKTVVTPWEEIVENYENVPVLDDEVRILGEVVLLIIRAARECFFWNDLSSYRDLVNSSEECKAKLLMVHSKTRQVPDNYIQLLERDMYHINDSLMNHLDNYKIIADKLGCSLIPWDDTVQ